KPRSAARSSFMILRATSRGSASCSATNTVAIPPSPRKRLIVKRPATWRPMSAFWRIRVRTWRGPWGAAARRLKLFRGPTYQESGRAVRFVPYRASPGGAIMSHLEPPRPAGLWYGRRPMDILFVASELAPMVKVGGLADVVAALSKALRLLGHKVTIALPRYP